MSGDEDMEKLAATILDCKKCSLYKTRNKPVVGAGSTNAKIFFIGEAPGHNEDLQGQPFVGRAGGILDELLQSIGLQRDEVYIGNILKCRPPDNRNPLKSEIDACTNFLNRQIEIIQPEIICPLGSFAMSYIFEKFGLKQEKISNVRGKQFQINTIFGNVKIIPLYHPAVATYNPNMKNALLEDFKTIKKSVKCF